jgi:hypothetical protein
MKKSLLALIVSFGFVASAQDLACTSLLEPYKPSVETFTSLEQNISMNTVVDGVSQVITIYQILDMQNKRLYQDMNMGEMGNLVMRYSNGVGSAR